jgi:Fe-S-cluster containining protein
MAETTSQCKQCGTCCRKGGPALHREDRQILRTGPIELKHLVTVRKGEMAYSPLTDTFQATDRELIKTAGRGSDWTCCFYNEQTSGCTIYKNRPLECRLLQCWDTEPLKAVINKDILSRSDIIVPDDPILEFMKVHEQACPCSRFTSLTAGLREPVDKQPILAELTELVRLDLQIRAKVVAAFNIPVALELFYFGRPLFVLLSPYGIQIHEDQTGIHLRLAGLADTTQPPS